MKFPLSKNFIINNDRENEFLINYKFHCEVPLLPHPGAFGKIRKNHCHEGVDLYCEDGDAVYSMLEGTVVGIFKFTGEHVGSPWWNNTWSVLVEHNDFSLNYGEIIPNIDLFVGKKISEGMLLGYVKQVLLKDKGRPRSMLHLEMYKKGSLNPISIWDLNQEKPENLLDPTPILNQFVF